ncbi:hypothetical protein [Clostridium cellulovorans]|uniref:DNA topology modulation protein FlaR n=1 Tax=Clostridium cellulovorans (strain ATCC 35296 / DSM 3052 / OCM 3 / 743B) TaxID=573061 RepID=D9SU11_CLOC7|nr:hypothetical protein [Clostridium cellulovorans]ADL50849.1 hypothetical protein Clocel_1090 [Clostridium cellulovorans 743B]
MSKIYIIGIVASGKTTLARRVSQELNIPHHELDCIVWNETDAGRFKRTPEEQVEVIEDIDRIGAWIIEGTYRSSCHCLFDMADKIIFLDTPLWKRRYRILSRFIKQQLGIEKCHYKSNLEMLRAMYKWTSDFEKDRPEFENRLKPYMDKVVIIKDSSSLNINLLG